ncbi:MAG: Gfo/Idh/MocA family oxidoreductase [Ruminococcaceae bacterium]|nr:Gfo/Idh/MocA family oxidoreductase [Oscillospiraceae bacterium]
MKIRVGIIGMGYIGESHIEAIRRIGICQLCAVADTNYELAKQKAEAYGIEKVYASVDEMLNDKDIDAVHNCTPNFLHMEINEKIIRSGKHLFSEKPLTMNYEQAKKLLAVKKEFPEVEAAVNFNYRLNPLVQEIRSRIKKGEAGDIRIITGYYNQDWLMYDTDYSWRLEPEVAGNSCCIADIGSHWMDIIQHVTGHKIVSVMGDTVTVIPVRKKPAKQQETFKDAVSDDYIEVPIKNEEYAAVLFKTDKGATGVFHVTEAAAGHGCDFGFEINGSLLSYGWNQEQNDRMWIGRRGGDNSVVIRNPNLISDEAKPYTNLAMGHPEGWNDAFKGNFYAFYKYLYDGKQGERIYSTLEDAAYIVKLTEKIIESSKQKTWINIEED